jgi:hypothetical protein
VISRALAVAHRLQKGRAMKRALWLGLAGVSILLWSAAASASTRICVSVQQKSWFKAAPAPAVTSGNDHAPPAPAPVPPPPQALPPPPDAQALPPPYQMPVQAPVPPRGHVPRANPHDLDPTLYLKRMLEYEVTHEPGYSAVSDACTQRLTVELYPLETGWTVFARYSGTEREEKVDHADVDEFAELAQRIAFSLLRNRAISHTITRENVLRSDSETNLRTIDGTGHFLFGLGTEARLTKLPTAQGQLAPATDQLRLLTPVAMQIGYRRKLRAWGLDAFARLDLGTESTGLHTNDLGGNVDYTTSVLLGLHFLHYLDAPGINSLYFGGGAAFELAFFQSIVPLKDRPTAGERQTITSGGLNVDFLIGYEFLRASSVHFYGQLDLEAPTYVVKADTDAGTINAYMPGFVAQIGIIF